MELHKSLNLLSLARKGGNIEVGEEPVGAAARAGKARLIVVASDASEHTVRRVQSFVAGTKQSWLQIPFDKDQLGQSVGRTACAVAALTDASLALAFVKALDAPEQNAELLAQLEDKARRIRQRQQEQKAHRDNIRHGRKKS